MAAGIKTLRYSLNIEKLRKILENKGIEINEGLTDEEFEKIESFYNIKFPQVLRILYKAFLPNLYNWRDFSEDNVNKIKNYLAMPIEGIIFDIEYNNFWLDCFGEKTGDKEKDKAKALEYMKNAKEEDLPKLIPIYSHRYVPSFPDNIDVPILSVHQTDIIYYGRNIEDYFEHEFDSNYKAEQESADTGIIQVPFWSKLVC